MGLVNLELQREMRQAARDFVVCREAINEVEKPNIPKEVKKLSPEQRSALFAFQEESLRRVAAARKQALAAQELAVRFHSTSGPLLYRRRRTERARREWDEHLATLDSLEAMIDLLGPYE